MTEGRIPPQSIEAELSVLGAMMLKPAATTQAIELLRADEFYRQAHRAVFETMEELVKNGEPVDIVTVTELLKKKNLQKMVLSRFSLRLRELYTLQKTEDLRFTISIKKELTYMLPC